MLANVIGAGAVLGLNRIFSLPGVGGVLMYLTTNMMDKPGIIIELQKIVQDAILEGRIGRPSFMRCVASTEDPAQLTSVMDDLTSLTEVWFGALHSTIYSPVTEESIFRTALLKWSDGRGALITASVVSSAASDLNIMLIGSSGALYYGH